MNKEDEAALRSEMIRVSKEAFECIDAAMHNLCTTIAMAAPEAHAAGAENLQRYLQSIADRVPGRIAEMHAEARRALGIAPN